MISLCPPAGVTR